MAVVGSGERTGTGTPGDGGLPDRRDVMVQVRAVAAELPPLRVVAADLAARADFDLDTVADLRLAVDEAAAQLVAVSPADAVLTCIYSLDADQMVVVASVPATDNATVVQDSFGWRVLTTLVDEVRVLDRRHADPPELGISLSKRRSGAARPEGR